MMLSALTQAAASHKVTEVTDSGAFGIEKLALPFQVLPAVGTGAARPCRSSTSTYCILATILTNLQWMMSKDE